MVGRVAELLQPRWTTPDGARPANPYAGLDTIFVPVSLQIEQLLKGPWPSQRCYLAACGGKIGEDEVTVTPGVEYHYAVGERTVLFLAYPWLPIGDIDGLPVLDIKAKYSFDQEGRVGNVYPTTPSGATFERLTWQDFMALIAAEYGGTPVS